MTACGPLKKSDFHYDLPAELIAQAPLAQRSASRLLVVDVPAAPAGDRCFIDRHFGDLGEYLRAGDLLVFNDTRVLPARLYGHKETGGAVEVLIERVTGAHEALAQRRRQGPAPRGGRALVEGQGERAVQRRGRKLQGLRVARAQGLAESFQARLDRRDDRFQIRARRHGLLLFVWLGLRRARALQARRAHVLNGTQRWALRTSCALAISLSAMASAFTL